MRILATLAVFAALSITTGSLAGTIPVGTLAACLITAILLIILAVLLLRPIFTVVDASRGKACTDRMTPDSPVIQPPARQSLSDHFILQQDGTLTHRRKSSLNTEH